MVLECSRRQGYIWKENDTVCLHELPPMWQGQGSTIERYADKSDRRMNFLAKCLYCLPYATLWVIWSELLFQWEWFSVFPGLVRRPLGEAVNEFEVGRASSFKDKCTRGAQKAISTFLDAQGNSFFLPQPFQNFALCFPLVLIISPISLHVSAACNTMPAACFAHLSSRRRGLKSQGHQQNNRGCFC